jgi:preprotein translocase subunit SecD
VTLRGRLIAVGLALVLGVILAFPSFFSPEERQASAWIPDNGLNLGLDLQGGIHWLLRIDTQTAIEQELDNSRGRIEEVLLEEGLDPPDMSLDPESGKIEARGGRAALDRVAELAEEFTTFEIVQENGDLTLQLTEGWHDEVVRRGVVQAQEVLRRRIDSLGVTEPVIAPQGEGRILVQMPGEIEPQRARRILESTTFLEFKEVRDAAPSEELLLVKYPEGVPEGLQVVFARTPEGGVQEAFVVPERADLVGSMLEDARLDFDRRNRPIVSFQWNVEGTRLFREFTRGHVGERMAAIIDGEVVTAPVIRTEIGRRGQIEGNFAQQEAADLAVSLRSGALPIPLLVEEERSVGPALGADSIRRGLISILIGGAAVVVFMSIYYQTAGLLAVVALVVNLVIIIAIMGLAGATLTMPGIAGLVLTVGMAVDANVIIFERIREEKRAGKNLRNAVQQGFRRSALTILDANITTMIAAVVLYQYGRGPVQGFGVTLGIGILSSVFTALVVTRLFIDAVLARWPRGLRI